MELVKISMLKISKNAKDTVKGLIELPDVILFKNESRAVTLKLFMPRLNGYEFDYLGLQDNLSEVVIDFALSRKTVEQYIADRKFSRLNTEAKSKFKDHLHNKGELGELLLYMMLEGYLSAPQILSKMALKTNSEDYVKGADGIHFVKVPNSERYHLIYGESKLYDDVTDAFREAFRSISRFTDNENKDVRAFELALISSQIENEVIDDKDKALISQIIYPSRNPSSFSVSDAFGIFIGFNLNIPEDFSKKSEDDFENAIKEEVYKIVNNRVATIEQHIIKRELKAKNFYVFLIPFTNLNKTREELIKGITK